MSKIFATCSQTFNLQKCTTGNKQSIMSYLFTSKTLLIYAKRFIEVLEGLSRSCLNSILNKSDLESY